MQEIKDIEAACHVLQSRFHREFPRMDFIFVYRHKSGKTVINVLRSLPGLRLMVTDPLSPDVSFESTWVGANNRNEENNRTTQNVRWQDVSTYDYNRTSYMAHSFAMIRRVREIAIFDYGFEIRTADHIDVHGVKSVCLRDPSAGYLQSICGETFKGLPLRDDVNLAIESSWRHEGDTFMNRIKKQLKRADAEDITTPVVGQYNRKLLLESDGI